MTKKKCILAIYYNTHTHTQKVYPSSSCMPRFFSHVGLFATPGTVAHQAPLSVGILQARILEWVTISSSRGSSWPRDWTRVSCGSRIIGRFFTTNATWEANASSAYWLAYLSRKFQAAHFLIITSNQAQRIFREYTCGFELILRSQVCTLSDPLRAMKSFANYIWFNSLIEFIDAC